MAEKQYTRVNWVNNQTPLNATNLNKMDKGIDDAINGVNDNSQAISQVDEKVEDVKDEINNVITYQQALDILEGGQ